MADIGNQFRRMLTACLVAIALFLLWTGLPLRGEENLGWIHGQVRDSRGAAVAEATVTARNVGTDARRDAQTGADGRFDIPELAPGVYEIQAEQAGTGNSSLLRRELHSGEQAEIAVLLQDGSAPERAGTLGG